MDAADPRFDYLSGTDCTGGNILYGILKERGIQSGASLFLFVSKTRRASSLCVIEQSEYSTSSHSCHRCKQTNHDEQ